VKKKIDGKQSIGHQQKNPAEERCQAQSVIYLFCVRFFLYQQMMLQMSETDLNCNQFFKIYDGKSTGNESSPAIVIMDSDC